MPKRDAGSYEPGRLRRAAVLAVRKIGPKQYRVRGQQQKFYEVDLSVDPPCYCADSEYRGMLCKHALAAHLHDGNMTLIQALGNMLLASEKRMKEATKRTRPRPHPRGETPE